MTNEEKITNECIFCNIIARKLPAKILYENEYVLAFLDIFPASNGHSLVIPKQHCKDLSLCDDIYLQEVAIATKKVALAIEKSELNPWGFNYLSNQGKIAQQQVWHYHMHIIPKYSLNEGFEFSAPNKNLDDLEKNYSKIKKSLEV